MMDFKQLTLGEVSFIEDMSGRSISDLEDTTQPMGKLLAALACIAKRRNGDPKFTWNAALAMTMDEANEAIGFNDEDDEIEEGKDENSEQKETETKRRS